MTHLRKLMLEELQRRNYAPSTVEAYTRALRDFAQYFHLPPDQLGPEQIRQFQLHLLHDRKLAANTVKQRMAAVPHVRKYFGNLSGRRTLLTPLDLAALLALAALPAMRLLPACLTTKYPSLMLAKRHCQTSSDPVPLTWAVAMGRLRPSQRSQAPRHWIKKSVQNP